ncbi:MAG TPA: response regulator transcription factor [Candidatus Mailhella merdigallinarum]|uniref:Response regulator transcription factor n=1 Tax=Candidatus Mailhella merdigallinarum TaxID=2838658 RepID=A0A9D2HCU4_9BACT|nr:response regulator transcription factor [Desulfovibrionaceae bacterium]HJA08169.1 response regulator transcription factor [Candidatus Mailhella merdigallinarum]
MTLSPQGGDAPLIFVVDDDRVLCGQIADYLAAHGYAARRFHDTEGLMEAVTRERCALILLDVMLPGEDGLAFCRRLRADPATALVPVIFLSALGEETDRVVGLELGADDYIVKPFSSRELLARVRTLLRRTADGGAAPARPVARYRFGGWTVEARARLLIDPAGVAGNLSAAEFRLLRVFLEHPQEVVERETLLKVIQRPADTPYDRVLDVQISRLRARLGESAKDQRLIRTARGDGYMLAAPVEKETDRQRDEGPL